MLELFRNHSRNWKDNHFVYPVVSRRSRGLSIGINLNPDRVCNFDCVYCSVDRTAPEAAMRRVEPEILRAELDAMLELAASGAIWNGPPFDSTPASLRRINDVAFSGDGEPTSCERFGDACRWVAELLAKHRLPDVKIVVITNATLFHRPAVADALAFLDQHNGEIWAKLDAGTSEYFERVERTKVPFARILSNILDAGRARPIVIQSLFMKLDGDGPGDAEIAAYVDRLRELKAGGCQIRLVQVYTVARQTAESFVSPLENTGVDAIAARVREIGLDAQSFYGPT